MPGITRKSIRISTITKTLLEQLRPELAEQGAGYIVDVIAHEQAGLPAPMPPAERRRQGARKRGRKLKGKPALNPSGRKKKTTATE